MIRVIVADDEEKVAQLVCNLVDWQALGMEVVGVAHNGLEALTLIRSQAPHIVITDIRMPGCDGLELISQAKEVNPELEFIIISGYRHFDYAQSAIRHGVSDYLLKPVNKAELTATLEKMRQRHMQRTQQLSHQQQEQLRAQSDRQRLRSGIFSLLAQGEEALPDSLEEINQENHFAFVPGVFEIDLLKLDGDYDVIHTEGLGALRDKAETLVEQGLSGACAELEIAFSGTTGQILLNYLPQQSDAVRKALRDTLDKVLVNNSVLVGGTFVLVRGQPVQAFGELPDTLAEARRLLASRLYGTGHLLEGTAPPAQNELRAEIQEATFRSIETALDIQSGEALQKALDEMEEQVATCPQLTGEDILALCHEVCTAYLMLARNRGLRLADSEMVYDEYCARLDLCGTKNEALACLRQTVRVTFDAAMQAKNEADAKPIRGAKQYIAKHYMRPITLEEVADQAGFNPSYFSTLFKKETGRTFSEYLTEQRVDKAKELLRDTNQPVAKVCEAVGYADLKHFTSVFKKHAGIKPGEFRKLYS